MQWSRQKAGIWWGLVTLTGMFSDMWEGGRGLKKSLSHSSRCMKTSRVVMREAVLTPIFLVVIVLNVLRFNQSYPSLSCNFVQHSCHTYHSAWLGRRKLEPSAGLVKASKAQLPPPDRALRIRTAIYVGLGLINCVLISLAFKLLQSILFIGYSAVGLDGEIF